MIQLFEKGAYLLNGTELIAENTETEKQLEARFGQKIDKKEAKRRGGIPCKICGG